MSNFLDTVSFPEGIKDMDSAQLKQLASEIREKIIDVTSRKGGHLAASLGAVDLAVALHYCLDSPKDKIVWDVGHQSYAHKLLTGRAKRFETLRELGGLSGFPNCGESPHDPFTCGHSATSISSAFGLASARDIKGEDHAVVAVIGDAALSTGMAFEGMNNAGSSKSSMLVVLNDNEHSISKPVGAMSKYLNTLITNPLYTKVRDEAEKIVKSIPGLGRPAYKAVKKFQEGIKNLLVPGIFFTELGFRYLGPIDGHDLDLVISILKKILPLKEPVFLHTITKKGKGYKYAEEEPVRFHGVTKFDIATGSFPGPVSESEKPFTEYFSDKMVEMAKKNDSIVAITAAMPDGTGLQAFADAFPERFFDVGITEPHAVAFAAGLAKGGLVPVVAIYSTFLQRSYDQLIHDVALQKLPVIFCLDRAGLVGKDGPTHHGIFDISYMRSLPGFIVMSPKDGIELENMLEAAVEWRKPVAIRYPRGNAKQLVSASSCAPLEIGRAELLRKGKDLSILAVGNMVNIALETSELLSKRGIEATVVNARFIKPLDGQMLEEIFHTTDRIFTLEEGIVGGGFGSAVLEFIERENVMDVKVRCLGLPDEFIEHGERGELMRKFHLTPDELAVIIETEL